MTQDNFQEHVLKELAEIKNAFIKNERDHGELNAKIESVRTEVESVRTEVESVRTEVESVRTEMHRIFNSQLRWIVGLMLGFGIKIAGLVFIIVKYVT